jgi:tetratricopeptide (TPR) repeat protein
MNINGLLLYELVLIIAGSILFLALVFILVYNMIKNRSIKGLLLFFIFPIVMIGFPSFQSIAFENGKFELKKLSEEVKNNPSNETKREELEKVIKGISEERIVNDLEASRYVAEAQLALGNINESEKAIKNAILIEKDNKESIKTYNEIKKIKSKNEQYHKNIEKLNQVLNSIEKKEKLPQQEIENIKEIISKTEVPLYTDEKSQIVIAKSLEKLGDKKSFIKILNNVIKSNPNSKEAKLIKKVILNDTAKNNPTFEMKKFEKAIITE